MKKIKKIMGKAIGIIVSLVTVLSIFSFAEIKPLAAEEGWLWPVPSTKYISQYYSSGHTGIDIASSGANVSVVASRGGTVTAAYSTSCTHNNNYPNDSCNWGMGNYVQIKHPDGSYETYMHLKYGSVTVKNGENVAQGTLIGYMGSSGKSTGQHLHFQSGYSTTNTTNVNPSSINYKYETTPPQSSSNVIYPGMAGFTNSGSYWWNATGYGINGTMKYTYCNGNTRDSWGKWSFNLSTIGGNGYYKVEAYIPNNHATTSNAHYHILHSGKTDYKSINQNNFNNAWVDLGTYDFTSDGTAAIELDDATGESYTNDSSPKVGFDAVRLTYVSSIDSEPPSGSWITPTNGGNVVTPGSINLSVNATDNKSIAKVVFHAYYDGLWHELGTDSHGGNGTYSLTWNYQVTPQNVEFHAHLYDTSNNWKNILGPIVSFSKPTVNFNSQGGSLIASMTANYNSTITEPTEPMKTGYTFCGWYKEAEGINPWNFATDKVTVDTTLYAKWTDTCDIDKDGTVSKLDLALFAQNYNTSNTETKWNSSFDFNKDDIIDIFDLVVCSKRISID